MRKLGLSVLFLLISTAVSPPAAEWPATPEGHRARAWVEAFSTGETSMRTYLEFNLAAPSLAGRSMEDRLASYRKLRQQLGSLRLVEVTSQEGTELRVVLFGSESDERHDATFRFQAEEPRKLLAVELTMRQPHGFFGH